MVQSIDFGLRRFWTILYLFAIAFDIEEAIDVHIAWKCAGT